MPESELSSEVSATTLLPASSSLVTSVTAGQVEVDLSWTNQDNSTDGTLDVERSEDGFTTIDTVAPDLAPTTTSYTDTTVSSGTTYEYRIKRNTDHATTTSGSVSQRAPKMLTRSSAVTGDGQLSTTRVLTKTRASAVGGDGTVNVTRLGATKPRHSTVAGDGQLTATRAGATKPRTTTLTGDAQLDVSRSVTKARTAVLTGGGQFDASRIISKARTAGLTGDAQLDASRAVTKPRTATLTGNGEIEAFADFSEALGERLNGVLIDYDTELRAFATEWYAEHPIDERQDLMSLRFTSQVETPLRFAIESDTDGDGEPDHRSPWQSFEQGHVPRIFPSVPTDAVQYRVLMRGLRTQDVLRRIDTSIVY